jgi:hypothetical protein
MKIVDVVFDVLTGEETRTERNETPTEKKLREEIAAQNVKEAAEAEAREIAKAAILDRLGLTADELKTILG